MSRDNGYAFLGLSFTQLLEGEGHSDAEADAPIILARNTHDSQLPAAAKLPVQPKLKLAQKPSDETALKSESKQADDAEDAVVKGSYGHYTLGIEVPDLVLVDNALATLTISQLFDSIFEVISSQLDSSFIQNLGAGDVSLPYVLGFPNFFSSGDDIRDFNLESASAFDTTDIMNAYAGSDIVILPNAQSIADAFNFVLSNTFYAGEGDDTVTLGNLGFNINLGSGDDTLIAGAIRQDAPVTTIINNTIDGGAGTDTLDYSQLSESSTSVFIEANLATNQITYSQITSAGVLSDPLDNTVPSNAVYASDSVSGFEKIIGTDNSAQGDTFTVSNVTFNGFVVDGGGGDFDTVSFQAAASAISFNLSSAANISNVESILGSDFNDTLTGDANNNVINGGAGNDILTGGAGSDNFVFDVSYDINGYMVIEGFDQVIDLTGVDTLTFRGVTDKNLSNGLDVGDLDLGTPFGTALLDFGAGNDIQTNLAGAPNGQIIFTGIGTAGNTITSFADLAGFYDIDII